MEIIISCSVKDSAMQSQSSEVDGDQFAETATNGFESMCSCTFSVILPHSLLALSSVLVLLFEY